MTIYNDPFFCAHFDCVFYDQETEFCNLCSENYPKNNLDNNRTVINDHHE